MSYKRALYQFATFFACMKGSSLQPHPISLYRYQLPVTWVNIYKLATDLYTGLTHQGFCTPYYGVFGDWKSFQKSFNIKIQLYIQALSRNNPMYRASISTKSN